MTPKRKQLKLQLRQQLKAEREREKRLQKKMIKKELLMNDEERRQSILMREERWKRIKFEHAEKRKHLDIVAPPHKENKSNKSPMKNMSNRQKRKQQQEKIHKKHKDEIDKLNPPKVRKLKVCFESHFDNVTKTFKFRAFLQERKVYPWDDNYTVRNQGDCQILTIIKREKFSSRYYNVIHEYKLTPEVLKSLAEEKEKEYIEEVKRKRMAKEKQKSKSYSRSTHNPSYFTSDSGSKNYLLGGSGC